MPLKSDIAIYCSFCGKSQHEAEVMLAGPVNAFICDECVETAVIRIAEKRKETKFFADARACTFCQPEPLNA